MVVLKVVATMQCSHSHFRAQFNGQMTIGKLGKTGDEYTYEAWFRSPLEETGPEKR